MNKSPEEYFQDAMLPEEGEALDFSDAERAFLEKYLGLEEDILDRLGIEEPAAVNSVELAEVEPAPAPAEALESIAEPEDQPETVTPEIAPLEPALEATLHTAELPADETLAATEETLTAGDAAAEFAPAAELAPAGELSVDELVRQQEEVQLVSFFLAGQEFTIPIQAVQEVVRFVELTAVPESPPHLGGIVNLRGRVTPVLRLGVLIGKQTAEDAAAQEKESANHFIIVCKKDAIQVGLLVEKVHTMYRAPQSAIEWNVEQRMGADVEIVRGLLRSGDGLIGVVSLERILEKALGAEGGLGG